MQTHVGLPIVAFAMACSSLARKSLGNGLGLLREVIDQAINMIEAPS